MGAPNGTVHYRVMIDPNGKAQHPNVEPLCNKERIKYMNQQSVGYMLDSKSAVTCLACLMLLDGR